MLRDAMDELVKDCPEAIRRRLPYPGVSRPVKKQERDGLMEATWYERSPVGLACRSGFHVRGAEVILDVWETFVLNRRLECPCGKHAHREVY